MHRIPDGLKFVITLIAIASITAIVYAIADSTGAICVTLAYFFIVWFTYEIDDGLKFEYDWFTGFWILAFWVLVGIIAVIGFSAIVIAAGGFYVGLLAGISTFYGWLLTVSVIVGVYVICVLIGLGIDAYYSRKEKNNEQ